MAQPTSFASWRSGTPFVDPRTGRVTNDGSLHLEQIWRQLSAGFVTVPVIVTGTNVLTLTPKLGKEGAASYGDHMAWAGIAASDSTGPVTAVVTDGMHPLGTIKVFINGGAAQADAGDVLANRFYVFFYATVLDSGAGGLVLK